MLRIKSELLQLLLDDGARDDPVHAAAVDAQHEDDAPTGQWRRPRAVAERMLRGVHDL
jgi:hypothetical protein